MNRTYIRFAATAAGVVLALILLLPLGRAGATDGAGRAPRSCLGTTHEP
jgi:hypothetical protein